MTRPADTRLQLGSVTAHQSLRQMDGVISKIDQEIAAFEPSQAKFARSLLNQLRQAAQLDMFTNVRGDGASAIAGELKALDQEFGHTMSQLFETAAAKKFGTVRRRGIKGVTFDEATRTPIDQLSRLVVNLESPQVIEELSRVVAPGTMQRITARVMDDALDVASKIEGGQAGRFDVEAFARHLGLDKPGNRRNAIGELLNKAGVPLTLNDLDSLVASGRAISSVEIPNVQAFIARRATFSGLQALINGAIPGLTVIGGTAYAGGSVLGVAAFIGGGRLVSKMISTPESARALSKVLDKEATRLVKREAFFDAIRIGTNALVQEADFDFSKASTLKRVSEETLDAYSRQVRDVWGKD